MQTMEELWSWVESFIPSVTPEKPRKDPVVSTSSLPSLEGRIPAILPETADGSQGRECAELRFSQFCMLCRELGSPQQRFRSVHVAGSKGKGQTASYIAHGMAALGLRVGLFRSPHIHSYSERIQVLQYRSTGDRQYLGMALPQAVVRRSKFLPLAALIRSESQEEAGTDSPFWDISETLRAEGRQLRQDFMRFAWGRPQESGASTGHSPVWYPPNFFAVLTLLAYRSFASLCCDWAVLETGIGGRLCPSNAVEPELAVLTPIELEHTEILGDSLAQIATEKAGIIKPGRPCVAAEQRPEVTAVLQRVAAERSSHFYQLAHCRKSKKVCHRELDAIQLPGLGKLAKKGSAALLAALLRQQNFYFAQQIPGQKVQCSKLSLRACSSTQVDNLELALLSLQALSRQILPDTETNKNWDKVLYSLDCRGYSKVPGRFSTYWLAEQQCLVLFDGAHTPVSCQRLLSDLDTYVAASGIDRGELTMSLLFASVQGKNFSTMAEVLAQYFDEILLTRAGTFKNNDLAGLEQAFKKALEPENSSVLSGVIGEPHAAFQQLLQGHPDMLVVCGSFYLLGELLP